MISEAVGATEVRSECETVKNCRVDRLTRPTSSYFRSCLCVSAQKDDGFFDAFIQLIEKQLARRPPTDCDCLCYFSMTLQYFVFFFSIYFIQFNEYVETAAATAVFRLRIVTPTAVAVAAVTINDKSIQETNDVLDLYYSLLCRYSHRTAAGATQCYLAEGWTQHKQHIFALSRRFHSTAYLKILFTPLRPFYYIHK